MRLSTAVHQAVWLAAAAILASTPAMRAQQQTSRVNWPCGARVDPAYFEVAEGTGGELLLLARGEIGSSAELFTAFDNHPQTIFRLAGMINPGLHEFRLPIDSSVESAMFSISVQCLQTAEVLRPSGTPPGDASTTDLSNFVAERLVIVAKPEPGLWTVRVSGTGLAGVMVKARSEVQITNVEFAPAGSTDFKGMPTRGVENVIRIGMRGNAGHLEASAVNAGFKEIAALPLVPGDSPGRYVSRFTPAAEGFRISIKGQLADATSFQRTYAPLFTAR